VSADRYESAHRIIRLLEPVLADDGFELLDVRVFRGGGRTTVRVLLDHPEGMTLDACSAASRTVGMHLEEADPFPEAYVIEVSSPGVRRPLRTDAHYQAAVGQDVILKVAAAGGVKTLKGRLEAFGNGSLTLLPRGEETLRKLARADVREANLDPEFDAQALIQADRRRKKEAHRQERAARRGGEEA